MIATNLLRAVAVVAFTISAAAWAQETPPIESGDRPAPYAGESTPSAPPPAATPAPAPAAEAPARSETPRETYGVADKKETFGAVMAPAALPGGSNSGYVYIGVQNVGAGYRQGVSVFEVEGRASFNYLLISLGVDAVLKWAAYNQSGLEIAPYIGAGIVLDSGARFIEQANFAHFGLKLLAGATATYKLTDTLRGIANLEIPYDLSLSPSGGNLFNPLVGVGAELYLGEDISAMALGSIGLATLKEPLAVTAARFGYQFRLGVGYRFF